ncbi:MAG: retroviral-like aspartic protease family protein [Caulobacteraceae bacterium]
MKLRLWVRALVAALAVAFLASGPARAACVLQTVAQLPVRVEDGRIVIPAEVNGKTVKFFVDTGAEFSFISEEAAQRLGLKINALGTAEAYGVGGERRLSTARIARFRLGGLSSRNQLFAVTGGGKLSSDPSVVGAIGTDVLDQAEFEFDLAHGAVRLFKARDCADAQMPYWAKTTYSQADLEPSATEGFDLIARVYLDGRPLLAAIDSGSPASVVTLGAARTAGEAPGDPGVTAASPLLGTGPHPIPTWVGRFKSFKFGDETIGSPRIFIADVFVYTDEQVIGSNIKERVGERTDMLLGMDFLEAHRILFAPDRRKIYFTYAGGPVFGVAASAP